MRKLLFFILLLPTLSFAQIKGIVTLGGDINNGNYRSFGVTMKTDLKQDLDKYSWGLMATYRFSQQSAYGSQNMVQYENEKYLTGNLSKTIGKWKVLLFTEDEQSFMRNIDLRGSLGLGIGHKILKDTFFDISLSEVILPEFYMSSVNTSKNNSTLRASTRFSLDFTYKQLKLTSVTLFQPAVLSTREVNFFDNLNARSVNNLTLNLNTHYAIGLSYIMSYQGYPTYVNKEVNVLEQSTKMVLTYKF